MNHSEKKYIFLLLAAALVFFPSTAQASDFSFIAYYFLLIYGGSTLLQTIGLVVFLRRRKKTSTPRALATGIAIPTFPWLLSLYEPICDLLQGDWYHEIFFAPLIPAGINLAIALVLQGIALLLGDPGSASDLLAKPRSPATIAFPRLLWNTGKASVATKKRKTITLSAIAAAALVLLLVWESPKHFSSLSFRSPRVDKRPATIVDGKSVPAPNAYGASIMIQNSGSRTLSQGLSDQKPLRLTIAMGSQIDDFHYTPFAAHANTPFKVKRDPKMPRRALLVTYEDLAPRGLLSARIYYRRHRGHSEFSLTGGDHPINLDHARAATVERNENIAGWIFGALIALLAVTFLATGLWDLLALIFTTIARPFTKSSG